MLPVEKSKRFQAYYHADCLWWRERAKWNKPFQMSSQGKKNTSEPSVTQSHWKKMLFSPHTWSVTFEISLSKMRPTLQWRSQQRSQENLVCALCLWLSQRLQWVKKKKKKAGFSLSEWYERQVNTKTWDYQLLLLIAQQQSWLNTLID